MSGGMASHCLIKNDCSEQLRHRSWLTKSDQLRFSYDQVVLRSGKCRPEKHDWGRKREGVQGSRDWLSRLLNLR